MLNFYVYFVNHLKNRFLCFGWWNLYKLNNPDPGHILYFDSQFLIYSQPILCHFVISAALSRFAGIVD